MRCAVLSVFEMFEIFDFKRAMAPIPQTRDKKTIKDTTVSIQVVKILTLIYTTVFKMFKKTKIIFNTLLAYFLIPRQYS